MRHVDSLHWRTKLATHVASRRSIVRGALPGAIALLGLANGRQTASSARGVRLALDSCTLPSGGSVGGTAGKPSAWGQVHDSIVPYGVAVDSAGNAYVADTYNYRIQKFDGEGNLLTTWGSFGAGPGTFNEAERVAVDGVGHVYVADTVNHRIQKFASDGTFLTVWGTFGSERGAFQYPRGIAVSAGGDVYVADTGNDRIQKFDDEGTFLTSWGDGRQRARGVHDAKGCRRRQCPPCLRRRLVAWRAKIRQKWRPSCGVGIRGERGRPILRAVRRRR